MPSLSLARPHALLPVSARTADPSALMTWISLPYATPWSRELSLRPEANAMRAPSGAQSGEKSRAGMRGQALRPAANPD